MLAKHSQALETLQSISVGHAQPTDTLDANCGHSPGPGIVVEGGRGEGKGETGESRRQLRETFSGRNS